MSFVSGTLGSMQLCSLFSRLILYQTGYKYKVVQMWPWQTVTCLHTNSPGHIWTTLYLNVSFYRLSWTCFEFIIRGVRKIAKNGCFASSHLSVCLSVCPSVLMEQLGSHLMGFSVSWYFRFFRKSVKKIKVQWKSDKNNGYFIWRRMHIYDNISLNFS
jgi:hypothetical protein